MPDPFAVLPPSEWRLLDSGPGSGAWNLALDDAVFRCVREGRSPPTLRLYAWSSPTLSIGYAQDLRRDVDTEACRAHGVEVLRRSTGGRAVLHDREVTYSVSVPAGTRLFGSGLETAYRAVAAALLAGLRRLGVDAAGESAGPRDPARGTRSPGCFAAAARHEILVGGRKLVGSAQRRVQGAFLQQGSILLESHAARLGRLLRADPSPGGEGAMVGIADLLRPCPTPRLVVAAVAAGCVAAWGVRFAVGAPSGEETAIARERERDRYRSPQWTSCPRPRPGPR